MIKINHWIGSRLSEVPAEIYEHVTQHDLYHLFEIDDPKWAVKTGNLALVKAVPWKDIEYRQRKCLLDIAADQSDIEMMDWLYDNNISTEISYLAIIATIQKNDSRVWSWYYHKDPEMFSWIQLPIHYYP